MIKNSLLLILVSTVYNEANASYRTNENKDSKERRNLEELTRIVRVLNGDTGVENHYGRTNSQGTKKLFEKYNIVKLLQKKYPKEFDTNSESGVRIHFIKNPEVLDHFVKTLRKHSSTSSSSSSDSSDIDRRYGDDGKDVRRNAMFRVQDRSNEYREDPILQDIDNEIKKRSTQHFPQSIEDQVTPFKLHYLESDEKKPQDVKRESSQIDDDGNINTKRFKVKSKDKKNKENDMDDKSDETHDFDENKPSKKESKARPWDRPKKKKPKDNAWDSAEETPKPNKKPDINWDGSDNELTKKSVWESQEKTKKKKKKDQKKKNKQLDNSEDVSFKKKTVMKWDEPKKKKKQDWDEPENKREVDNDWDKVGKDWDKGKDWDSGRTSKSSWKPKKKNSDDFYKPSYVARNPVVPKGSIRGGSFQGRTPIPFVGKRGIYDDK